MAVVDILLNNGKNAEYRHAVMKKVGSTIYARMPLAATIAALEKSSYGYIASREVGKNGGENTFCFSINYSGMPQNDRAAIWNEATYILQANRLVLQHNAKQGFIELHVPMKDSYHNIIFDDSMISGLSEMAQKGTSCAIKMNGIGDYEFISHTEDDGSVGMHISPVGSKETKEERQARQMAKMKGSRGVEANTVG